MNYIQHFLYPSKLRIVSLMSEDKAFLADDPKAFQCLKFYYTNVLSSVAKAISSLPLCKSPTVCVSLLLLRLCNCYCFQMGNYIFLHSSVACLGFLCKDGGCQLLGVCDVGAPGHHPAHQLRGEDVAQVNVHFLPHVSVAAVCRGFWVLWQVG